jgi:ketosteroid isomerase-like protein
MPKAEEPGHAHEHAPGEEHDKAPAAEHQQAGLAPADAPNHDAEDTAGAADLSTPIRVAEAFAAALKSGDAASVERLLMPDVVIAEGGGAERSFAEYFGHHMPADMAFMKDIDVAVKQRDVIVGADMATVVTASQMHGSFQGRTIHHRSMETLVLKKAAGNWRIAHIHWSSAPITGEHEH